MSGEAGARSGRGRRLRRLAVAAVLLLAALKWGGQALLNRYAKSLLGPGAGTFEVSLLSLGVRSKGGSGSYRGLSVSWEGIEASLWRGRLTGARLSVGGAGRRLLEAEGLRADGLFGGRAVVTAERLRVDAANPRWRDLLPERPSSGAPQGKGAAATLWLKSAVVETPVGELRGSGLLLASGKGDFRFSARLGDGRKTDLNAQGSWSNSSGEISVAGEVQGCPLEAEWNAKGTKWRAQATLMSTETGWKAFAGGIRGAKGEFLLLKCTNGQRDQWLLAALDFSKPLAQCITTIDISPEGMGLAESFSTPLGSLTRLKMNVGNYRIDNKNKSNNGCYLVGLSGTLEDGFKTVLSHVELNLNWVSGEVGSLYLDGSLKPSGSREVQIPPSEVRLGAAVEGLFRSPAKVTAALSGGALRVQLFLAGSGEAGEGQFQVTHPYGKVEALGRWGHGRWEVTGTGRMSLPQETRVPLPAGSWTGGGEISGDLTWTDVSASLHLAGPGTAAVSAQYGPEGLRVVAHRATLKAAWGEIRGLDLRMNATGEALEKQSFTADVKASAEEAALAGLRATRLTGRASLRAGVLAGEVGAVLPGLEGSASTEFRLALRAPSEVALARGGVSLFGGEVLLEGLQAGGLGEMGRVPARWSADRSTLFGLEVAPLEGTLEAPRDAPFTLTARGAAFGGRVGLRLIPSDAAGGLRLEGAGLDSPRLAAFLGRWVDLRVPRWQGPLDATVQMGLSGHAEGLTARLTARGMTLSAPDDRHQFRGLSGTVALRYDAGGLALEGSSLALDGGRVPVAVRGAFNGGGGELRFDVPKASAKAVQNAFFDFLPEYLGYGDLTGEVGLSGVAALGRASPSVRITAEFHGTGFASEDRALRLEGLEGRLPFAVGLGGERPSLRGFRPPDAAVARERFQALAGPLAGAEELTVRRMAFSVYEAEEAKLGTRVTPDGATEVRVRDARLWDGALRGEVVLGLGADGLRYTGQLLLQQASLREFCSQAGGLTGFLSGRASAHLTFGADRLGMSALKLVARLAVDPQGDEPLVLGRDFLVKVGGNQMKRLVPSRFQVYDRGALGCGVRAGNLTIYDLVLEHRADPLKALLRKDISFELRVPFNSSISLYRLLDLVKGLQERSAVAEQK